MKVVKRNKLCQDEKLCQHEKILLAQPGILFLLLPLCTAVLMTTLPTTGFMWSSFPFNMMSASGLRMWQPSLICLSIGRLKHFTTSILNLTDSSSPRCVEQTHSPGASWASPELPSAADHECIPQIDSHQSICSWCSRLKKLLTPRPPQTHYSHVDEIFFFNPYVCSLQNKICERKWERG